MSLTTASLSDGPDAEPSRSTARTSPCGRYRYSLTRQWGADPARRAVWIMLNPSTADATVDDPTVRRCLGFSRAWGCDSLEVVNLFALRATDPRELRTAVDPVGPENDGALRDAVDRGDLVVAAWGAHGVLHGRAAAVRAVFGPEVRCLGVTKAGMPRHPLYVRSGTPLTAFGGRP